YCPSCQDKFTVRVGSIFERSHIPLHKWLLAFRLMASSKKGISAHQLHRTLGITYKSAWFMAHRIREAMAEGRDPEPLGGKDKVIEADETFIGREGSHDPKAWTYSNEKGWQRSDAKMKVMTLVERGGKARSVHVDRITSLGAYLVLSQHADPQSELNTDEAPYYRRVGRSFAKHESVNHAREEYARGKVTTNTVEGFFSIFKRGMKGVYQHCGEKHLHRYLAEFDFRYSNRAKLGIDDSDRTTLAIQGAEGKRLTYRRTGQPSAVKAARARRLALLAQRRAFRATGIRVYRSAEEG
ncbi:MAG: IS1595 family transposase, partial [Alphaproteobacteria bacterium]|nr:IS1595 family transposase [Alphaproteobacteria bacterium]